MFETIETLLENLFSNMCTSGFFHNDMHMANIYYNRKTETLSVIDFGVCDIVAKEEGKSASIVQCYQDCLNSMCGELVFVEKYESKLAEKLADVAARLAPAKSAEIYARRNIFVEDRKQTRVTRGWI